MLHERSEYVPEALSQKHRTSILNPNPNVFSQGRSDGGRKKGKIKCYIQQ